MKCKECLTKLIKQFDLFSLTQFLRYDHQQDFKTFSGGVTSILVVVIFTVLFAGNALRTINKSDVTWLATTTNSFHPTLTQITFTPQNKLMFSVGVLGIDLNNPSFRYFDFQMVELDYKNQIWSTASTTQLVPCTREHFNITEEIKQTFDLMGGSRRLCPPLGSSSNIFGKIATNEMRNLEIIVKQCNSSLNLSRPCINQTIIDDMITAKGSIDYSLIYVNPLINPANQHNHLDYYLQDKNLVSFTKQQGTSSVAFVEDFTIETDENLLTFSSTRIDQGVIIPTDFQTVSLQASPIRYASFNFAKASTTTNYQRSFNKLDQFFSYVGGLVGSILGLMLFMSNFSLMAFELDIAQHFFRDKEESPINFSSFNIFHYFLYLIYKAGSFCGLCKSWQEMRTKIHCKEEILKQLDVKLLLRRINFLQRAAEHLLGDGRSDYKKLYKKQTIIAMKRRRRNYRHLSREVNQEQEKSQQSSSSSDDDDLRSRGLRESTNNSIQTLDVKIKNNLNSPNEQIDTLGNEIFVPKNLNPFQKIDLDRNQQKQKIKTISLSNNVILIQPETKAPNQHDEDDRADINDFVQIMRPFD